jgi:hypothetical protein
MVLNFRYVLILPYLSYPLPYLFSDFILEEIFVLKFDVLVGRIILMDEQRNSFNEDGELVLIDLLVLEDAIDLVLVFSAVVEEDDGEEGDCDLQIVDHIDHLRILGSVLVVAR